MTTTDPDSSSSLIGILSYSQTTTAAIANQSRCPKTNSSTGVILDHLPYQSTYLG